MNVSRHSSATLTHAYQVVREESDSFQKKLGVECFGSNLLSNGRSTRGGFSDSKLSELCLTLRSTLSRRC